MSLVMYKNSGTFKPSDFGLTVGDKICILCVGGGGGGGDGYRVSNGGAAGSNGAAVS